MIDLVTGVFVLGTLFVQSGDLKEHLSGCHLDATLVVTHWITDTMAQMYASVAEANASERGSKTDRDTTQHVQNMPREHGKLTAFASVLHNLQNFWPHGEGSPR